MKKFKTIRKKICNILICINLFKIKPAMSVDKKSDQEFHTISKRAYKIYVGSKEYVYTEENKLIPLSLAKRPKLKKGKGKILGKKLTEHQKILEKEVRISFDIDKEESKKYFEIKIIDGKKEEKT